MKCPEWKFVDGEGIESIAYDQKKKILFLKFRNNADPYSYQNVPDEMYEELMDQEHKTTFFNQVMRPVYKEYKKIPSRYFEDCK